MLNIYIMFFKFLGISLLRVWRPACPRGSGGRHPSSNICSHNLGSPLPALLLRRPRHLYSTTMPPSDPTMPPANADLATTWAYLEEGVDHIMNRLREGGSTASIHTVTLLLTARRTF